MAPKDQHKNKRTGLEIAVVGMAGRFPGAGNIQQLWENLKNSVESISFFSDEELIEAGVDPRLLENPKYVKAKGVLENVEYFDSSFFGYAPVEAKIMDPQVRVFHECAWEALEDAAYIPGTYSGLIGIYAGALDNFYWQGLTLLSGEEKGDGGDDHIDSFSGMILRSKDFLATRVAYKLDLKGPAVSLQTACSTSLVAIDSACRALLGGMCDMALAGGVAIWYPHKSGYLHQEGIILSSDGHCRAFDAQTSGTVSSEGAGVVVLKRLEEAEADGDHIYAIIKGSAINNDGTRKVGFSAPGIEGQAEVINTAMYVAEVEPDSIGYIEAHGTGTVVGDTVEMEALKMAFKTNKKQFCAVGSLKTNVGHMDTAAGVASFIKAVLVLKHGLIPPSLYFKNPNPAIDFENSPFYVNTELREWRSETHPLRAGVSSYGIGGTNVHVVLEEVPKRTQGTEPEAGSRKHHLILLSAKTKSALDKASENLATHLKNNLLHPIHPDNLVNPGLTLADAAYTLQVGREVFNHRRSLVCASVEEVVEAVSSTSTGGGDVHTFSADAGKKSRVVFMFPGQGAQYVNMGIDLYKTEPVFREAMDHCFDILKSLMGYDLKEILYPPATRNSQLAASTEKINQTEIAQPVLFAFEYALATLLISWGIAPDAMIGHSIGEYTAACLANVFSLEDALKLVALRGHLMQQMPGGSMLSLLLAEEELRSLLSGDISLAAVNSPSHCVVSGTDEAIDTLEAKVKTIGYQSKRLHTSHAFHSRMMEPILKPFMKKIEKVLLNKPQKFYISNITGRWATAKEAADPRYWARHLRETARFSDGIKTLLTEGDFIFVEVGPGKTLSTLVKHHDVEPGAKKTSITAINLVRHPKESKNVPDDCYLLDKVGQLWLYGIIPDWSGFHRGRRRYRIPLPTYPFERRRYPIKGNLFEKGRQALLESSGRARKPDTADWFYVPLWEQSLLSPGKTTEKTGPFQWLVFTDSSSLDTRLVEELESHGHEIISVSVGTEFNRESEKRYTLNPRQDHDYNTLFEQLSQLKEIPRGILHLWNITVSDDESEADRIRRAMDLGFYSLLNIVTAVGSLGISDEMQLTLTVVTSHLQAVTGEETIMPEKAVILGALRTISREYPHIRCRCIDILPPPPGGPQEDKLVKNLLSEFLKETSDRVDVAAWRGNHRWVQQLEPYPLDGKGDPKQHLREAGVYLVTGGLGGMGLTFAQHLAEDFRARLILLGRSAFPPEEQWEEWLISHDDTDPMSLKIRKLQEFQKSGAEIMVANADIADIEEMQELMARATKRFGTINGVIHAAGLADYEGVIHRRTRQNTDPLLAAKVEGTLVLDHLLKDVDPDFVILCSSLSSILAPLGEVAYNAANAFLDAFAHSKALSHPGTWISINWGAWQHVGMAVEAVKKSGKNPGTVLQNEILPWEGIDIFHRLLEHRLPQVAVFPRDLVFFIRRMNISEPDVELPGSTASEETTESIDLDMLQERPNLSVEYAASRDPFEQELTRIWQRLFGLQTVGIHDDFFELGGDSLKGMMFVNQYKKLLGEIVHVPVIFDAPTIAELAVYFSEHYPQAAARIRGEKAAASKEDTHLKVKAKVDAALIDYIRQLVAYPSAASPVTLEIGEEKNPSAIFILSPARSGSTLLRVILVGHPKLFAPPELFLLPFNTLGEIKAPTQGILRAIMQIKGCSLEETEALVKELGQQNTSIKEFYRLMQQWIGDRILVDKTPAYTVDINVLKRVEAYFENPLYIHLVRHPYGMIRSYEEARMDLLTGDRILDELTLSRRQLGELNWTLSHQNILKFFSQTQVPENRRCQVKFEELVSQPEPVVKKLCHFLGIEFYVDMLDPYKEKKERMVDGIHEGGLMIGDVKFLQHKFIDPTVADTWKDYYKEGFLGDITRQLAKSFSYQLLELKGKENRYASIQLAEKKEYYHLSSSQERLYVLHQINPESTGYNMPINMVLEGDMNRGKLEEMFKRVIQRHESLRSAFILVDEKPVQKIHKEIDFKIEYDEVSNALTSRFIHPFDLSRPPMLRVGLVKIEENKHLLMVDMHHIITDGISQQVLQKDFFALFRGEELPALRLQYKDFSEWWGRKEQVEAMMQQETYWIKHFASPLPQVDLPTDYPRPAFQSFEGASIHFSIGKTNSDALKTLALQNGVTLQMLMVAIFHVLLSKMSLQEDIITGTTIAARRHVDLEKIIGLFANTLPIRSFPSGEKTFPEFLKEIKKTSLNAYENQDYPFESLVKKVVSTRDMSRNPLFDVMFEIRITEKPQGEKTRTKADQLIALPYESKIEITKFDQDWVGKDTPDGISFSICYCTKLFKPETIALMVDGFFQLIENIIKNVDSKINDLDHRTSYEKELAQVREVTFNF